MRWKLSKGSFRQKELTISDDKKSMSFETNQKNNVFTITQLTPSEIITTTATTITDNNISCQKYKPRLTEDSNFDNNIPSTETSGIDIANNIPSHNHNHHYQINNNNIRRRSSFEEALKIHHPDQIIDKYRDNTNNSNGDIFIISSNQTEQRQHQQPWTNHHHHHNNLGSDHLSVAVTSSTTTTSAAAAITDHAISNHSHHHNHHNDGPLNTNDTNLNTKTILDNNGYNIVSSTESNGNNFHYINSTISTSNTTHPSSNGSLNNTKIGSTTKLLPNATDDQSSTQTQSKCSYFGGLILCLCLNSTHSNIVRFPRELDKYGTAYLIPYFIILFLVGLPIILLEVSIGQFLGQGAANTWRASPIFKGASVVSRFASWLAAIWISMQATLAIVYIGMLILKSVPFSECASGVKIIAESGYKENDQSGQECIQKTFLAPIWVNAQYFGFLSLGLVLIWLIMLVCTYNAKVFRRSNFFIGIIGFALLISLAGWEVYKSLGIQYFPQLWQFNETILLNSNIWFNALIQVIYSTNIGFGIIPVITGKFLHKGDAIRTTILYFCFNLLINTISVILFMVQFDNIITRNSDNPLYELKPITSIYDKIINENDLLTTRILPGFIYLIIVISAIISICTSIYTSSRLVPRHPSYILNLLGLIFAVMALLGPKFIIARVLDSRIVGTLVIVALIFDLIATTWIYGVRNLRTDLEFSIGRTIYKIWMILWCLSPIILSGLLIWWCIDDNKNDLLNTILPRWSPIIFVIAIISLIACIEIFKQVDYNFFGMIGEAAKPAKEWGPADPLARHAWKQWRSVCQDTGRKDFTLRRRGTRDYTHSIKRGQYSTAAGTTTLTTKYGGTQNHHHHHHHWKSSTPGNSSPNYSGSVFGDSAIEEDMSVDKYSAGIDSNTQQQQQQQYQFTAFSSDNNIVKPINRYSNRSNRKISHERQIPQRHNSTATATNTIGTGGNEKHREIVYVRRLSNERNNSTKIEITPANDSIVYSIRNPIASSSIIAPQQNSNHRLSNSNNSHHNRSELPIENNDHICWRKFSVNSEEYSTEL